MFHFLVGENRTRITIHTEILRLCSPPLYALATNGVMKESINQEAVLEDVEESVFLGFCEFAYRGFYVTPRLKEKSESNDPKKDTDAKEDSSSFTTTTLLAKSLNPQVLRSETFSVISLELPPFPQLALEKLK